MTAFLSFSILLVLAPLFSAGCLIVVMKLLGPLGLSKRRVAAVGAAMWFVTSLAQTIASLFFPQVATSVFLAVYALIAMIGVWTLHHFLTLSWKKSVGAWLLSQLFSAVVFVPFIILVHLLAFEAFTVPMNSMAPTIVGFHERDTCPQCGDKAIVGRPASLDPQSPYSVPNVAESMICTNCKQISASRIVLPKFATYRGDRIVVDKTLAPQRWDVIAYRYRGTGATGDQIYISRLVGLPGEVIELRSGELWVNEKPATYAADMVGLVYREDAQASSFAVALTECQPFTLQENEYFLLGDYSTRAMDSRYMGPIAGQDIVGVVTWIYWPPPRWRIFR